MTTTITHYQVTDYAALCEAETMEGTTIEARVTCPRCKEILAKL